jgi:hypothetical protein
MWCAVQGATFQQVILETNDHPGEAQSNIVALLAQRIEQQSTLRVRRLSDPEAKANSYSELLILIGTSKTCPSIVFGYPFDFGQPFVPDMLWEGNRPSQRTMHYTQDEERGVTFHYRHLDPKANYRIRFTLVRPWYQERYRGRMNQHTQSIYAGDILIARDIEVPERMSDFFTFEIPREALQKGELIIRFERAADVARGSRVEREVWRNSGGWGTIVSEAWLLKSR